MEMIINQPIIRQKTWTNDVLENKQKFRVDLSEVKTLNYALAARIATHQTKALTNVNVAVSTDTGKQVKRKKKKAKRSIYAILYAIGFLIWFLTSY